LVKEELNTKITINKSNYQNNSKPIQKIKLLWIGGGIAPAMGGEKAYFLFKR
jgi:hypothetical protein